MDINTIFYFVGTKSEYETKWQNGDINGRTIVFVTDTGEIYKNGIRYGGLTRNEVINESTTIVNNNEYDDTEIRNSINRLLGLIDGLNSDIDDVIEEKEGDIIDVINGVLSEYSWLKKNLGDVFASSQWQQELSGYLTAVGNLTGNSPQWTTLLQTVNSITGRVNSLEGNQLTEAQVKAWINNGVAGIDLSTYALKSELGDFITMGDISDFITMDDLRDNFESLLTVSTSFLSLRSDIDSATAAIGSWGRTHNNDTITDLFGALQIQVDNLEDSVTTTLSSTVRQYLDDDLANGVGDYLENQAGLILTSNLDSAVAGLFSQTTSTKTAVDGEVNSLINTAGFMTESDLDGAMATIFAQSDNGGAYDSTETYFWFDAGSLANVPHLYVDADVLTVNAEHTLTEMVGHVYDSYDQNAVALTAQQILDTITMISESTTPPTVGISYASKANPSVIVGEITRLSKAEAALHKSKLYAAIQVGVKNDQSFIDAVADRVHVDASEVEINASQLALTGDQITISAGHELVLNGITWADILNVKSLVSQAFGVGTDQTNPLEGTTLNSGSIYVFRTDNGLTTERQEVQLDADGLTTTDADSNIRTHIGGWKTIPGVSDGGSGYSLYTTDNAYIGDDLTVAGDLTVTGDVTVSTGDVSLSSDINVNGDLSVDGSVDLSSTLTVGDDASFSDDVTIYGTPIISVTYSGSLSHQYEGWSYATKLDSTYIIVIKGVVIYMGTADPYTYNNGQFVDALTYLGTPMLEPAQATSN